VLVEDRPRVDLRRHLERDPRRDIGLDQAGDDIDRRALGGDEQMEQAGVVSSMQTNGNREVLVPHRAE